MTDDAHLVAAAVKGDKAAVRALYDRHRPAVARVAQAFAELDADEISDLVQETFVRAFRALPRLREPARFGSWVLTIARNRCITFLAKRQMLHRALDELGWEVELAREPAVTPLLDRATQLEADAVRTLVASLPEGPEKQTVQLFYVEGELSARQIADRLGVGKSTVTMRLERFRAKVKRVLMARILALRGESSAPADERRGVAGGRKKGSK